MNFTCNNLSNKNFNIHATYIYPLLIRKGMSVHILMKTVSQKIISLTKINFNHKIPWRMYFGSFYWEGQKYLFACIRITTKKFLDIKCIGIIHDTCQYTKPSNIIRIFHAKINKYRMKLPIYIYIILTEIQDLRMMDILITSNTMSFCKKYFLYSQSEIALIF